MSRTNSSPTNCTGPVGSPVSAAMKPFCASSLMRIHASWKASEVTNLSTAPRMRPSIPALIGPESRFDRASLGMITPTSPLAT